MHGTGFWRRHMEEKSAQQLAVQPLEWDVFTWMFQAHLREQCMRSFLSSSAQTLILVRLTQQEAVDLSKNANILTNKTLPGAFFFSLWHHRVLCTNVIADIKSNASAYAKSVMSFQAYMPAVWCQNSCSPFFEKSTTLMLSQTEALF